MVKSKVWLSLISLFLIATLVLAGCNSSKSPKEALQSSMTKSAEIKTYSFKGSIKVEELNIKDSGADPQGAAMAANMLKNMDLSWTGAYRLDPMLLEMTMTLAMKGDMAINLNIPVIMNKEKIWVKIPNIPILPLPQDLVGKFLEIDIKKLAEQSGQPLPEIDPGKSQKLVNDILAIIFKNVDEKQYLSAVKVKEAGLPDDVDAKQVIRFKVNKDQVEPFVNTVIDKIAPEVIDLLSNNEEYRKMFGLKQEDLDQAKSDLASAKKEDIAKGMAEFKKAVKALEITANIGIDGKEYPVYSDAHVSADMEFKDGGAGTFAFKVVSELKDINKEVKFEFPDGPKDVVTMEQFQEQMGGLFGGGLTAPTEGM